MDRQWQARELETPDDVWAFAEPAVPVGDLVGYTVEALHGRIGRVDDASTDTASCCLVVAVGRLATRKVAVPAGFVTEVDRAASKVHVNATKEEIRQAPDYEPIGLKLDDYKASVARHYLRSQRYREEV
jgi:hypothetical protein